MKVFISQPMNRRSDEEILKERGLIAKTFEYGMGSPVEVIDSFSKSPDDISKGRVWMLGTSIALMHDADYVIFAPGWKNAKGCVVEEKVAELYGLKRVYYNDETLEKYSNYPPLL